MPNVITDATPFLNSLVSAYTTSLDDAKARFSSSIESYKRDVKTEFDQAVFSMATFISQNPLNLYIDGEKFRSAASSLSEAANTEAQNKLSGVLSGYRIRISNSQIDFNQSLNDAYSEFNSAIFAANVTDPDYSAKYEIAQASITTISGASVEYISGLITDANDAVHNIQVSSMAEISSMVKSHIMSRPIIRLTGKMTYPTRMVYAAPQTISIEVQNIGTKPWYGSFDFSVQDEYYKTFLSKDPATFANTIPPGKSKILTRSITVPRAIEVKLDNGSSEMRNMGKKLKYRFILNTKKQGE